MVRIVEYRPAPEVLQQVICKHCGALLEYTPKEVQKYSGTDISGGPDGMHWIDCPQCGERVNVEIMVTPNAMLSCLCQEAAEEIEQLRKQLSEVQDRDLEN